MTLIVIFSILFSFTVLKKIVLESIGKQNSALLHYLREDEKQSTEFSKEKYISEKETCITIFRWLYLL